MLRSSKQIISGYEVAFELFTLTLPDDKIIGAQNLLGPPAFNPGNRIATLRDIQELREDMAHWKGGDLIWRFFAEPVNRTLSFADSTEPWIRRIRWEHWRCFWSVVFFLRNLSKREDGRRNLFCGTIEELPPIRERLSGPRQCLPALWATGDATLTRFASINWRALEFTPMRLPIPFLLFQSRLMIRS